MKENKPHHQALKEAQQAQNNHAAMVQFYRDQFLNRLCLCGISGQGIDKTFVVDVQGQFLGQIAVALSLDKTDEKKVWFDATQLRFYKVFTEEEATKFLEELKVVPPTPLKVV